MSIPSMIAIILYAVFGLTTLRTALFAGKQPLPPADKRNWWAMTSLFGLLIALRVFDVEHAIPEMMRKLARTDNVYDERRDLQNPLVATILIAGFAALALMMYRQLSRGKRHPAARMVLVSQVAAGGLVVLIMLRLISLHAVDALLYRGGPLRLNYILDFGASLAVAWSAWNYRRTLLHSSARSRRS